jgi:hypothetical protein
MMALYYFSRCIIHYYYLQDQEKNENDMWRNMHATIDPFPNVASCSSGESARNCQGASSWPAWIYDVLYS